MDDLVEVQLGKNLLELLEEKHQLPVTIIKDNSNCSSCAKPFDRLRQPAAEFHLTPDGLRLPILWLALLCGTCAVEYRSGGDEQRKVLAAVEESVAREIAQ